MPDPDAQGSCRATHRNLGQGFGKECPGNGHLNASPRLPSVLAQKQRPPRQGRQHPARRSTRGCLACEETFCPSGSPPGCSCPEATIPADNRVGRPRRPSTGKRLPRPTRAPFSLCNPFSLCDSPFRTPLQRTEGIPSQFDRHVRSASPGLHIQRYQSLRVHIHTC